MGRMKSWRTAARGLALAAALTVLGGAARAEDNPEGRVLDLERRIEALERERRPGGWYDRTSLGGYGEFHLNLVDGRSQGQATDLHRIVLYVGHTFNDWARFVSEIEIEHSYVRNNDGYLLIEQAYVEFLLHEAFNIRVGRVLAPVGIINEKHEPPAFNGVERPSVDRLIIPTTWTPEGIGFFGAITPSLKYQAYAVGGLDGSRFTAMDGIRPGRIQEQPGINELAFTGRLDFYPFAELPVEHGQMMRVGFSTWQGGLDNGNRGNHPGIDAYLHLYAADFEYTIMMFNFRGVVVHETILGAKSLPRPGVAEEIFGYYLEAACHLWPDDWRRGKLSSSDLAAFVRYDEYNTQFKMPSGVRSDPRGNRNDWTLGLTFFATPHLVVKGDYQFRNDASRDQVDNLINFGVGWQF